MNNLKKTIRHAVIRMLTPLIRMLLRYDVSHSEFTELTKRIYVEVAFKHFSIANRKQTNSRVSVITGLSRKEVVRISEIDIDEDLVTKGPLNRAKRVIGGWLSDPDFLDENNEAKVLPLRGEENSFDELATRHSGGITARAILDELIRVGAVEKVDKSMVRLTNTGYVPHDNDSEMIRVIGNHVRDHLDTSIHNLMVDDTPRFQREVTYTEMPKSIVDEFTKVSHEKSSALLVELNQWLADKEKNTTVKAGEDKFRIGVGLYYIQEKELESEDV